MAKKNFLSVLIILIVVFCRASAIGTKDIHPLVIDTDCAIDDMRAISIILSQPDIHVAGIVVTEGTLLPAEGAEKVRALLHGFAMDTIPVVCGKTYNKTEPLWRNFNRSLSWGKTPSARKPVPDAIPWLQNLLQPGNEKITYVCLGPLSTLEAAITGKPTLQAQLYRIIWYNESIGSGEGFNYTFDKSSADSIIALKVRMDLISNLGDREAFLDSSIYDVSKKNTTPLSRILSQTGSQPAILENHHPHHLALADELVSAYITNPELFDMTVMHPQVYIRYNKEYDLQSVKEAFFDMIKGVYKRGDNIVFSAFPNQREMYQYDVRKIMDSAISRHGSEEWKACVMTDEFHGHLGVFSIVGAKMGIRAREYFGVGPDMLTVVSYAGTKPPYSCLNDGIQVSTGATIGQGLITIVTDQETRPEAVFTNKGRSLRLKLKEEYLAVINRDIEEGILKFGLSDDGYWKLVRRSALEYWMDWNRDEIFEEEEINKNKPE
jgi:inosine-uridine nucleoside N-ribohydrolase/formylmethanofuran dehydrogenase subunit E